MTDKQKEQEQRLQARIKEAKRIKKAVMAIVSRESALGSDQYFEEDFEITSIIKGSKLG